MCSLLSLILIQNGIVLERSYSKFYDKVQGIKLNLEYSKNISIGKMQIMSQEDHFNVYKVCVCKCVCRDIHTVFLPKT